MARGVLDRIVDGRTDLVFDYLSQGHAATSKDENGVGLLEWCAHYGDVSALRFLLDQGESLRSLGDNLVCLAHHIEASERAIGGTHRRL